MDYTDASDAQLAQQYVEAKAHVDEGKVIIDEIKPVLMSRVEQKGYQKGKSLVLGAGKYTIKRETRVTEAVDDAQAATLLESINAGMFVNVTASISVKKDVDPKKIPASVIHSMEKYFDITLHKSVDKNILKGMLSDGKITKEQYDSVISAKDTYALKVEYV